MQSLTRNRSFCSIGEEGKNRWNPVPARSILHRRTHKGKSPQREWREAIIHSKADQLQGMKGPRRNQVRGFQEAFCEAACEQGRQGQAEVKERTGQGFLQV